MLGHRDIDTTMQIYVDAFEKPDFECHGWT